MRRIITLLTDFGTADGYVAQMKGVILSLAPEVHLVDAAHDLPAHDVEVARLTLARYWRRFPPDTIHVVVVDPGVGTPRVAMAVRSEGRYLLGPDNGVLSAALLAPGAECVALPVPPTASRTFHGRDVFAPAAARLAMGARLDALGAPFGSPVIRRTPEPQRGAGGEVQGEVIAIDRFGNAVTNLTVAGRSVQAVDVAGRSLPLVATYGEAEPGAPCALVGSTGLLEIAVREGSAAAQLTLRRGTPVILRSVGR
jgi:S-adenosyl-L-methionine hydrolase (adenosine-forming)